MRNGQVARIYRILNILEGIPQGLSAAEIQSRLKDRGCAVSKRTVYRDLEALSDAGFPIFPVGEDENDGGARWILEKGAKSHQYLALSNAELFALFLARGLTTPLRALPFHADLDRAFHKIEDKLGTIQRKCFKELSTEVRFEPSRGLATRFDMEVFETVRAACAEGQVLSVDYASTNSQTLVRRKLGPHYVYFAKGSAYLVAEDLIDLKLKTFALPRMGNAVMESEAYEEKGGGSEILNDETSFGLSFGASAQSVKLRFGKHVAPFVSERRWHPTQTIQVRPDKGVDLCMHVGLTTELVQWILGFGPQAEVLEPKELRDKIAAALRGASRFYTASESRSG